MKNTTVCPNNEYNKINKNSNNKYALYLPLGNEVS
jgi:hypothetical protein